MQIKTGNLIYNTSDKTELYKDNIHIVVGIDNNYVQQCAVTIVSALLNTSADYYFTFHIMNVGLNSTNKIKLESLKKFRPFDIYYEDLSHCDFSKFPLNRDWISSATYYRLFLPDVISSNIDKCIYMDTDMIVEDNIGELWEYDIDNYLAGVVEDENSRINQERLNLNSNNYFNAGLLLLNLKRIREYKIIDKAIEYYIQNKEKISLQDQDILNGIMDGKCKFLPLRWNINTPAYMGEKVQHFYSKDEEHYAAQNPAILHFTGKFKPWYSYCMHPLRKEYERYLKLTGFNEDIKKYQQKEIFAKFYCWKKYWDSQTLYIFNTPIYKKETGKNSFIENIFSIKNSKDKSHKIITILGIKISIMRKK